MFISPVSCWELAILARKRRVQLDRNLFEWIDDALALDQIALAPITPSAAASAGLLSESFRGDFADRFIYATARELAIPLVTRDGGIRSFARSTGDVRTIW